jgi:hypothetical protein
MNTFRLRAFVLSTFTLLIVTGGCVLQAQYLNVQVSSAASTDPEEVCVAINPLNPQWLAAGANIRYFYLSTDGGQTWSQSQLPSSTWGDPCVIYDGLGNLYYAHLAYLRKPGTYFIDRLIVHRSTNGGLTWTDSVEVGYHPPRRAQDKEWLVADMTASPFRNNVYMAWTEFDSLDSALPTDSTRILFSRSTDQGKSWSTPMRISDTEGNCLDGDNTVEGAVPAVGPNGEVYVCWAGPLGLVFDKSTDGGVTFGKDRIVGSMPGGWDFDIPGIYRANGLPITMCDVSSSPYRGTIYVGWSDQRNGTSDTDVFLVESTDGGETWSQPKRVNSDGAGVHQFFTWCTIDQTDGALYFVFYDRRATVGNATDVYMARSTDGGETFQNVRVSNTSFTPVSNVFFGDYPGIAARAGKVYPIWMRMDNAKLSVWTALVTMPTEVALDGSEISVATFGLQQNYPNPFNPATVIRYTVGGPRGQGLGTSDVNLVVYDLLGREVAVLVNEKKAPGRYEVGFDATGLAGGVYLYRISAGQHVESLKMILLR